MIRLLFGNLTSFQSPIGTQKTSPMINFCGSPCLGFNPLQVHKKQSEERIASESICRKFQSPIGTQKTLDRSTSCQRQIWFQSPIGTQKTYRRILEERGKSEVSIPYRYTKNEARLFLRGRLTQFQSPIGTQKTPYISRIA